MIEQLKTIREDAEWINNCNTGGMLQGRARNILEALTQLEAMVGEPVARLHITETDTYPDIEVEVLDGIHLQPGMSPIPVYVAAPAAQQYEAGDMASAAAQGFRGGVASVTQQEPVAWAMPKGDGTFIDVITPAEHARDEGSYTVPLFAHPVAQQPQRCEDCGDAVPKRKCYCREACVHDGMPAAQQPQAEPHKPLFADLIAQHPGLREELLEMDKQPQAEPFGYVSQHTNGTWEFSPTPAGVYPDTAKSITAVYTKQPQAEAVLVVDRVYEAAKRLVDHADFQLGGVLSAKSKARDIPSNAASKVKARHLASLRDALAKTPQQAEAVPFNHATQLQIAYVKGLGDGAMQAEAVPPDVVRDADVEAAAKKMAEIFDYPWDFMPEKGRNTMRENVRAVLDAAIAQQKGGV